MVEHSQALVTLRGNPTDEEVAAITAAYSLYISKTRDNSVDRVVEAGNSWVKATSQKYSQNNVHPGKTRSWVHGHRLKARN